jgi:F-type H+-transporting ATPase subunit b
MPQLDASTFPSQLFWLTVSFVVLYAVLARFLLPRVHGVLSVRAWTIESDIEQAGRMKAEAVQARETYEKTLVSARAQSQTMLNAAQAAVDAHAAQQQAALDATLEQKLVESTKEIRVAKQNVMNKLAPVSEELASLIVEVLVHHKPGAKELGAVISELAKERMV